MGVAVSVTLVITIVGCISIVSCGLWFGLKRLWRDLEVQVLKPLDRLRRQVPREGEMENRFEAYAQEASKHPCLQKMWDHYRSGVRTTENRGPLRSLRPARECFQREALALQSNPQLDQIMPNLLTGMGILFTFVGLIVGIWGARVGVTAMDSAARTQALTTLLDGAYLAFGTSAAGLFASLLLSFYQRSRWRQVDAALAAWAEVLDQRIPPLTREEVAYDQLTSSRRGVIQLERFNTDLAVAIATALDERQAHWLKPALQELAGAIKSVRDTQVRFDERLVGEVVEKFETILTGGARVQMDGLANAMAGAAAQLSASASTIADQQAQWSHHMSQTAEQLRLGIESATAATQQRLGMLLQAVEETLVGLHTQLQAGVSSAVANLQENGSLVSRQFKSFADTLVGVVERLDEVAKTIGEAAQRFATAKEAFAAMAPPLQKSAEELRQAAGSVNSSMQAASGLARRLQDTAEIIRQQHEKLPPILQELHARFVEVDKSAQGLFREINAGLESFSDQVRKFLSEVDTHLANGYNTLGRAVGDLNNSIEELIDGGKGKPAS